MDPSVQGSFGAAPPTLGGELGSLASASFSSLALLFLSSFVASAFAPLCLSLVPALSFSFSLVVSLSSLNCMSEARPNSFSTVARRVELRSIQLVCVAKTASVTSIIPHESDSPSASSPAREARTASARSSFR